MEMTREQILERLVKEKDAKQESERLKNLKRIEKSVKNLTKSLDSFDQKLKYLGIRK